MGTIFKYISDEILDAYKESEPCPYCERKADVFRISMDDGEEGPTSEACVTCIRTLPLRWISPKNDERRIATLVNERYPKGTKSQDERFALTVEMCDDYRRTPRLPNFIQRDDWPHCCGDFTEFIGDAGTTYRGSLEGFTWWGDKHDAAVEDGIEQLAGGQDRVSLFRCLSCEKKYWTFQCT
jgi:hypothetical protein